MRQAAKAGAGGGLAGGVLDGCNGCDVLEACGSGSAGAEGILGALVGILVVVVAAVLGMILFWLIRALVRYIREKMHRPQPHGALYAPPKPKKVIAAARGVVRGGKTLETPWREGSAYAWAMELHEGRVLGGGAMMRDARTAGFDLALEDGRVLRVPAGRIRVLSALTRVDSDNAKIEKLVAEVDRARQDDKTVFPFDFARAITIEEGDHVEVVGDITQSADASAGTGYRTSAGLMEPVGVPYLRVEKAARVRVMNQPPPTLEGGDAAEAATEEEEEAKAARR